MTEECGSLFLAQNARDSKEIFEVGAVNETPETSKRFDFFFFFKLTFIDSDKQPRLKKVQKISSSWKFPSCAIKIV